MFSFLTEIKYKRAGRREREKEKSLKENIDVKKKNPIS